MAVQKILKVGNSLGITLPASIVKGLSLRAGDLVEVSQDLNNILTFTFVDNHQLTLGLTSKNNRNKKSL